MTDAIRTPAQRLTHRSQFPLFYLTAAAIALVAAGISTTWGDDRSSAGGGLAFFPIAFLAGYTGTQVADRMPALARVLYWVSIGAAFLATFLAIWIFAANLGSVLSD